MTMSREGGDAADLDAHRREEPGEMATAFIAWFTVPAPRLISTDALV